MLQPQEVFPQEVADAQQLRQGLEHLGPLQRRQLLDPVRLLEQLPQEIAEVQQRRFGIGRMRQQVREVLDEHDRRPQFAAAGAGR